MKNCEKFGNFEQLIIFYKKKKIENGVIGDKFVNFDQNLQNTLDFWVTEQKFLGSLGEE